MPTTIVTRAAKGSELTWNEGDTNFTNLNAATLPVGGTTGEILIKNSVTDYDASWTTLPGTGDFILGKMTLAGWPNSNGTLVGTTVWTSNGNVLVFNSAASGVMGDSPFLRLRSATNGATAHIEPTWTGTSLPANRLSGFDLKFVAGLTSAATITGSGVVFGFGCNFGGVSLISIDQSPSAYGNAGRFMAFGKDSGDTNWSVFTSNDVGTTTTKTDTGVAVTANVLRWWRIAAIPAGTEVLFETGEYDSSSGYGPVQFSQKISATLPSTSSPVNVTLIGCAPSGSFFTELGIFCVSLVIPGPVSV